MLSKPDDLSLFLKKKPKPEEITSVKHYVSVDKLVSDTKNLSLQNNFHPAQGNNNTPVSGLYSQRMIGINHNNPTFATPASKFAPSRPNSNLIETMNYSSNRTIITKPEIKDVKYGNIYNRDFNNIKYNFSKTKPLEGTSYSFTNYFSKN